ncbi:MAG: glycoside hydrolase family 31 protein [Oscillospiraceae bacterium]|nr:glycoside hydrolase family 31 protein [Oscillospiraceae bacterium]
MTFFEKHFTIPVGGKTPEACVVLSSSGRLRVSVLSERLVRVERSESGVFEDSPTQIVWHRDFAEPGFRAEQNGNRILIRTDKAAFFVDAKTGAMRYIQLEDGRKITNYKRGNLKGTRRTLDATFGPMPLQPGLISKNGVAVLDDSASLLLDAHSRISPRANEESDKYYFAHGRDYRAALRDFYALAGPAPMIPRWALGNWWSRYYAYTQQGYLDLMKRFARLNIPLTVATIDIDWHWVDLSHFGDLARRKEKGSSLSKLWESGWTGYSWNTELFPDYKAFLKELREELNLKVTMNLHPADGVRAFEDQYEETARAMGVDPASQETIPFDIGNPKFVEAYFSHLHHPYEKDGVDFWWIDWQQGKKSRLPGLDPLWALNHYHALDNAKNGQGLTLSRYAGLGSHRYPLGFSGDTSINWLVLRFQPYFTAAAGNAGYGWWSHDIGGHHWGRKDDELYIRWLQFGVFNPINRLHTTSNEFAGKEPWKCCGGVERLSGEWMRLRHRLIPYLYSMARRAHQEGIALCEPLYYQHPDEPEAYRHRNVYYFGSELICAPITRRLDRITQRARAEVWLPKGRWTDIFTGRAYEGGRTYKVYRGLESIPVFAKAGAVLPMAPAPLDNDWRAPQTLCVDIYRGDNDFCLFEDEGETRFVLREEGGALTLRISAGRPRDYEITFRDLEGSPVISLKNITNKELRMEDIQPIRHPAPREALIDLISSFQMRTNVKKRKYTAFIEKPEAGRIPGNRHMRGAIRELLDSD